MVKLSGGEAMVQSLAREGVEVVFGIPGIHMSGIVAALRDEPSIRMVATRSEQAAVVCIPRRWRVHVHVAMELVPQRFSTGST